MYDADYDNYLNDLKEEATATGFVTRDSGTRAEHSDGVVRDTEQGKTKFTLMFPKGVPYEDQLIVRIAELYTRGGDRYGDRNWENSESEDTLAHHTDALWRHFMRFFFDVQDGEDHAAAIVWNINAVLLTRRNIKLAEPPVTTLKEDCAAAMTELDKKTDVVNQEGFKAYIFPYIGKDTVSTGRYCQKEVIAENYTAAKQLFYTWRLKQSFYATLEWAEGDVLEEHKEALDGKPYVWVYDACSDLWKYLRPGDTKPSSASAISSAKLFSTYGPLTCTKGNHRGRIVGGS